MTPTPQTPARRPGRAPAPPPSAPVRMRPALRPVLVALLIALVGPAGCQSTAGDDAQTAGTRGNMEDVVRAQQQRIDALTASNRDLTRRSEQLAAELERAKATEDAVSRAKEEISAAVREVQERFRGDSAIDVEPTADGYRFVLREQVLFPSGSATLSDEGKQALARVAGALQGGTSAIQIEGHTDDVPVAKEETLKKFPRGNIELSVMRALAVWDWLVHDGQVRESRVGVCGYGPHRPRVPNRTDQDRWQNRRVEIRVADPE